MPESGIPKPGPLTVHLKDDHLQYAITWFALAGAVVIAFGVWMRPSVPLMLPRKILGFSLGQLLFVPACNY